MDMIEFDYELPETAIAQVPAQPRDAARLLVDQGPAQPPRHLAIRDIVDVLRPGDLLVVNETRVIPARLPLRKTTGGAAEVLLLEPDARGGWLALVRPGRRLAAGAVLRSDADPSVSVTIGEALPDGSRHVVVEADGAAVVTAADTAWLATAGEAPLPPYITDRSTPDERYQTVYAETPGSVAAPTAGLHFTPELLAAIEARGVERATVDLVVGLDTFRPVLVDDSDDHEMHSERYAVPDETWEACRRADRVIAVGTTTVRALESAARSGPSGRTDLFLQRGSRFDVVDVLVTNFHMPRSTLLLMIDAFVGPRWRRLYETALEEGYRFLSFGDACWLERAT